MDNGIISLFNSPVSHIHDVMPFRRQRFAPLEFQCLLWYFLGFCYVSFYLTGDTHRCPGDKKLSSLRLPELGGVPAWQRELRGAQLWAFAETHSDKVSHKERCLQRAFSWLIQIFKDMLLHKQSLLVFELILRSLPPPTPSYFSPQRSYQPTASDSLEEFSS